jgi:hypothetical protein
VNGVAELDALVKATELLRAVVYLLLTFDLSVNNNLTIRPAWPNPTPTEATKLLSPAAGLMGIPGYVFSVIFWVKCMIGVVLSTLIPSPSNGPKAIRYGRIHYLRTPN